MTTSGGTTLHILGIASVALLMSTSLGIAIGRTLFGNRVDELSDQGADEGAWSVINHDQLNSQREQGNHG
jgi:hypothetical protein